MHQAHHHVSHAHTPVAKHPRLVARGDGFKVIAIGRHRHWLGDLYVHLLGASWRVMILALIGLYLIINIGFTLAYLSIGDGIEHARPGSFTDAFFFSVQTLATIGYGAMVPHGITANILVTLESMFGFAYYGVVTGLVYSKFSRPSARLIFSHCAIIRDYEGRPHFMARLANERDNQIVDAKAKLTIMMDEQLADGSRMRRFYDMPLVRSESPVLRLTWTVMHRIDHQSPLYGLDHAKLEEVEAEIILSINGTDETMSQPIHARHSYIANEIIYDGEFKDILHRTENYVLEVRYDHFHDLKPKA